VRGLAEEVFVCVFDGVIIGDCEPVRVWVVDGGGIGDHGFGAFCSRRRDDGD